MVASVEPNRPKSGAEGRSVKSSMIITLVVPEAERARHVVDVVVLVFHRPPHCLMTVRIVFYVDSFRLLSVLRAAAARRSGKRLQPFTSQTLDAKNLPLPAAPPPSTSCGMFRLSHGVSGLRAGNSRTLSSMVWRKKRPSI